MFGRRPTGRGGIFVNLKRFQVLPDQSAMGYETFMANQITSFFDRNMNFIRKETYTVGEGGERTFKRIVYLPGGNLGATVKTRLGKEFIHSVRILAPDRKTLVTLSEQKHTRRFIQDLSSQQQWVHILAGFLAIGKDGEGIIVVAPDQSIYTAKNNAYEITRWSKDLKPAFRFSKDYKPKLRKQEHFPAIIEELLVDCSTNFRNIFSVETFEKALEESGLPPAYPPILELIPMDGYLLVITSHDPVTRHTEGDLFSRDGVSRGKVILPKMGINMLRGFSWSPPRILFRGSFAYVLEPDEDQEYSLVRYRYRVKQAQGR